MFYPSPWSVVYHCWLIIRPYSMVVWPLSPWSMPMWRDDASLKRVEGYKEEAGKTENLVDVFFFSKICCFSQIFCMFFSLCVFVVVCCLYLLEWNSQARAIVAWEANTSHNHPQNQHKGLKCWFQLLGCINPLSEKGPKMYRFPVRQRFAFV